MAYLFVFLSTLAADFAWTKYNMHSAAKHAHRAAAWSSLIIAFGAFNVMSYTVNHWLIVPALLGAYVGTWLAVWWENRQNDIAKLDIILTPERLHCLHQNCRIVSSDGELNRWSCGSIEG